MNDFLTRYALSIKKFNLTPEPEALVEYFQSYYIIKPFPFLITQLYLRSIIIMV